MGVTDGFLKLFPATPCLLAGVAADDGRLSLLMAATPAAAGVTVIFFLLVRLTAMGVVADDARLTCLVGAMPISLGKRVVVVAAAAVVVVVDGRGFLLMDGFFLR